MTIFFFLTKKKKVISNGRGIWARTEDPDLEETCSGLVIDLWVFFSFDGSAGMVWFSLRKLRHGEIRTSQPFLVFLPVWTENPPNHHMFHLSSQIFHQASRLASNKSRGLGCLRDNSLSPTAQQAAVTKLPHSPFFCQFPSFPFASNLRCLICQSTKLSLPAAPFYFHLALFTTASTQKHVLSCGHIRASVSLVLWTSHLPAWTKHLVTLPKNFQTFHPPPSPPRPL